MTRAVRFHQTGGPEVLQIENVEIDEPGVNEIRMDVDAIGLNRAEVMFRSGTYLEQPEFPACPGYEAAGTVAAVGRNVNGFKIGEPINVIPAFSLNDYGVYAEQANIPAAAVVKQPENISATEAAAVWMQYLTAWGALIDIGRLSDGETVIIPAASSSVGLAAIQIANNVGAVPIAMTRTNAKAARLLDAGAAHVVVSEEQDVVKEVMRITNHQGARIVFDPVAGPGIETLAQTLGQGGTYFVYGNLSGQPSPFPLGPALLKGLLTCAAIRCSRSRVTRHVSSVPWPSYPWDWKAVTLNPSSPGRLNLIT